MAARAPDRAIRPATNDAALVPLIDIPLPQWHALAGHAARAERLLSAGMGAGCERLFAPAACPISALAAYDDTGKSLIGLMPAVSAWRAYKLPLPALVTADVWPALGTVLLDRDKAAETAGKLMQRARDAGAHALILRDTPLDGAVMTSFTPARWNGGALRPSILRSHERAARSIPRAMLTSCCATRWARETQGVASPAQPTRRLGEVIYSIASTPRDAMPALEVFLQLEASGWNGTARHGR